MERLFSHEKIWMHLEAAEIDQLGEKLSPICPEKSKKMTLRKETPHP